VLAYSTVSQLGYMVMALGVGGWTAGVFHLFTHAFFKACLFLGAGSVSHSGSHHSFDMKKDMGGLKRYMPITFWTFTIASLALAGIFPFAGFFSKDEILLSAGENGYRMFQYVGLVGAVMTAAYMTRCIYLTFFGEPRGAAAHHHPHESPWQITGPLIFLSVLSVVAGWLNATMFDVEKFTQWFEPATVSSVVSHHAFSGTVAVTGLAAGLLGILLGYAYYWRHLGPHGLTERLAVAHAGYAFLDNKYYLDDVYTDGVIGSIKGPIARAAYWVNQNVLDGVVNAAGIASVAAARFVYNYIDQGLVDGIVNGTGLVSEESGGVLRLMQSGRVQQYAAVFFAGVVAFAVALALAT
jgi:NADH-quinone oxidoreductase subunit L